MVTINTHPEISIIIPTYNEEENIGNCLKAVFDQNYDNLREVIIADNQSTDDTRKICEQYPVKMVAGGKPAIARNKGAEAATGELLLFLDADTILRENFLQSAVERFLSINSGISSFFLKPYPESIIMNFIFIFYNTYGWLASRINCPVFNTAGCCMLVQRSVHQKVGGFDEKMVVLEEYDYIRSIKKNNEFRVLPFNVVTSTRRFSKGQGVKKTVILFRYYFKWLIGQKIISDEYGYWKK
jgi:glycosyltransferase involved in cell wall biosynthesis